MDTLNLIVDFLNGLNIILALGSALFALCIIFNIGLKEDLMLTRGWKFIFPAIISFAWLRIYSIFAEYGVYSASRLLNASLNFVFLSFLFAGLLVQYLAIQKTLDQRKK